MTDETTDQPDVDSGEPVVPFTNYDKKAYCKICDLNFMNQSMLMSHAKAVHNQRPLEQVVLELVEVDDAQNVTVEHTPMDQGEQVDEITEVPAEVYLCSACGNIFTDEASMENHCLTEHATTTEQRVYECSSCHRRYDSEAQFDVHDCSEPAAIKLPHSGEATYTVMEVTDEEQAGENFQCQKCTINFVSKYALNRHNEIVHHASHKVKYEKGFYHCGRCSAVFPDMRGLKAHSVKAHSMKWESVKHRKPQQCSHCEKSFSSMGNLNKHVRVVHGKEASSKKKKVEADNVIFVTVERDEEAAQQEAAISLIDVDDDESSNSTTDSQPAIMQGEISTNESKGDEPRPVAISEDRKQRNATKQNIIELYQNSNVNIEMMEGSTEASKETAVTEEGEMIESVTSKEFVIVESEDNVVEGVLGTVIVQEDGSIGVVDDNNTSQQQSQAMVVQPNAELGGFVLELNENSVGSVLDLGEIHMVIEDQTEKTDTNQIGSSVTDETVNKVGRKKETTNNEYIDWYCQICACFYVERHDLLVHYRQHHLPDQCEPVTDSPQQCDICLKIFSTKGNRDKHQNTVHKSAKPMVEKLGEKRVKESEDLRCEVCGLTFRHKSNLNKHLRLVHAKQRIVRKTKLNKDATADDRTCHICGKEFPDLMKKEMHVYNHSRYEKEYHCTICAKVFHRSDQFKEHYEKKHGVPKFKCSYCDKRFVRKSYQVIHERVHTDERPYQCKICGKGFKQWGALHQHQRFHTPKPPATHFCSKCHRGYSYKVDLDRHMVVHTDRKHVCEYCPKAFPTASQLTVHTRTHTGHRPYKCNLCSMCFMTMGGLKRHEMIHERREHGGFMCAICGVSYRRQASVDDHIRVFHADRSEEPIEIQTVDLIECATEEAPAQDVIQFVVEKDGTVQIDENGLQVLTRCDSTWVDTTDIEKELVEGILASQAADNLIVAQAQEAAEAEAS